MIKVFLVLAIVLTLVFIFKKSAFGSEDKLLGKSAPEFKLKNSYGELVSLKEFRGEWLLVFFYPKDDTPGCTIEGNDFTRLNDAFAENNSVVYGVSRDSIASHEKFINKFNYTIDLISDEDESLCKQFDVLKLKKMYGKEHIGIVRSTFVISPDGDILKQWDKVKVDGHAEEVLDFVKSL